MLRESRVPLQLVEVGKRSAIAVLNATANTVLILVADHLGSLRRSDDFILRLCEVRSILNHQPDVLINERTGVRAELGDQCSIFRHASHLLQRHGSSAVENCGENGLRLDAGEFAHGIIGGAEKTFTEKYINLIDQQDSFPGRFLRSASPSCAIIPNSAFSQLPDIPFLVDNQLRQFTQSRIMNQRCYLESIKQRKKCLVVALTQMLAVAGTKDLIVQESEETAKAS
jgi:hypothetical protein